MINEEEFKSLLKITFLNEEDVKWSCEEIEKCLGENPEWQEHLIDLPIDEAVLRWLFRIG